MTDTTLDDAWKAAEAALLAGWWRILSVEQWNDPYEGRWYKATARYVYGDEPDIETDGDTPAAALLALTEKLREQRPA